MEGCIIDENLFIRQTWVKKKTRHTRMLAKRFIQLKQGILHSYKKAAWENGAEPTCSWNLKGACVNLKALPGPRIHWQLQIADGPYLDSSEEICFVFDSKLQSLRWCRYLERTAMFGSLSLSYVLHPARDVGRDLRGLDLPFFLRPLPLMISESSFVKFICTRKIATSSKVELAGFTTMCFLVFHISLPRVLFQRHSAIMFVISTQHSDSAFLLRMLQMTGLMDCVSLGGLWAMQPSTVDTHVNIVLEIPLLHRVEQTDEVRIRTYTSDHPVSEGGLKGMLAMATGQRATPVWSQTSDWKLPLASFSLYFNQSHSIQTLLSEEETAMLSLRCTVPWWHIFNSVPPEATPLIQEYNYSEWIAEGRKIVALFNKITRILDSAHWIAACEQPLTTLFLLLYVAIFFILRPKHIVLCCVVLPLLLALALTCPWSQNVVSRVFREVPLLAALTHYEWSVRMLDGTSEGPTNGIGTSPAASSSATSQLLQNLSLVSVPLTDDWNRHHGLVLPLGTYSVNRWPFFARCLKCVRTLFFSTVYGGWQPSLKSFYHHVPRVDHQTQTHLLRQSTSQEASSPSFTLWFLKRLYPFRTATNSIWSQSCLQVLREEIGVCGLPQATKKSDFVLRKFTSQIGVSTGSPSGSADEGFSSDSSEGFIEEDEPPVLLQTKRDSQPPPPISLMTKYTPKMFDSKPWKIKDLSILADLVPALSAQSSSGATPEAIEDMILRQTKRLSQPQQKDRSSRKGGLRGAFKDVTSVGRIIVDYRRSMERLINLFEWTHPLATLTLMLLLAAATLASPIISWPLTMLLSTVTFFRRFYQKTLWHRYAINSMQVVNFLSSLDPEEAALKTSFQFCQRIIQTTDDFAKGSVRIAPVRGWLMNVIDHTINCDSIAN